MSRVGLIGENSIEYINALLDIWNNGDCAVLIDWRIPYKIAVEMMKEASVQKCFIEKKIIDKVIDDIKSGIEFVTFERKNNSAELLPNAIYEKFKNNYSKDEAVVLYSSGTTGKAKGIILSHYAINLNADLVIEYMEPSADDCLYIVKTLAHSSTLVDELIVGLKSKSKIVISPTIVTPSHSIENIINFKSTILCLNPTLLRLYTMTVNSKKICLNHLKIIYTSGAIADETLIRNAQKAFPETEILNVYGLSEAGPRVSAQRKGNKNNRIGSVGLPINRVDIKIILNRKLQVQVGHPHGKN